MDPEIFPEAPTISTNLGTRVSACEVSTSRGRYGPVLSADATFWVCPGLYRWEKLRIGHRVVVDGQIRKITGAEPIDRYRATIQFEDGHQAEVSWIDQVAVVKASGARVLPEGTVECDRCGGTGQYLHHGVCFKCGGRTFVEAS